MHSINQATAYGKAPNNTGAAVGPSVPTQSVPNMAYECVLPEAVQLNDLYPRADIILGIPGI